MIIDCHYHIDPRMQPIDDLIQKMEQHGIDKVALMAALCDPIPENPEFLLVMFRFFLTHRIFRPIAKMMANNFTSEGNLKMPGSTYAIYRDPDNSTVHQAITDYPDKFIGWIFVNPRGEVNPVDEFNKWKDKPGFIGVKAHTFWHRYDPIELLPVAKEAAQAGKPLLAHLGFDNHGNFMELVNQVPDLKLVLAHSGFPCYADTWATIKDKKNIYVDLSARAYVNDRIMQQAVKYLGPDRCLFGTDGPFGHHDKNNTFDNGYLKRRIEALFPDADIQRKLFSDNFACIAGIE